MTSDTALEYYRRFAVDAVRDIARFESDEEFRIRGGSVYFAIDFSEIFAYTRNSHQGFWGRYQVRTDGPDGRAALAEIHESVMQFLLFEAADELVLLEPYGVDLLNYHNGLRAHFLRRGVQRLGAGLAGLQRARRDPDHAAIVALAQRIKAEERDLRTEERRVVAAFIERNAPALMEMARLPAEGDALERFNAVVQSRKLKLVEQVFDEEFIPDEGVLDDAFQYLRKHRPEHGVENETDARALALIYSANARLLKREQPARLVLVTRSATMDAYVRHYASDWSRVGGNLIRHPRGFLTLLDAEARIDMNAQPSVRAAVLNRWRISFDRLANPATPRGTNLTDEEIVGRSMAVITDAWRKYGKLRISNIALKSSVLDEDPLHYALSTLYDQGALKKAIYDQISDLRETLVRTNLFMSVYLDEAVEGAKLRLSDFQRAGEGIGEGGAGVERSPSSSYSIRIFSAEGVPMPFDIYVADSRLRSELEDRSDNPLMVLEALGGEGMTASRDRNDSRTWLQEWYLCLAYAVAALGLWEFADECLLLAKDQASSGDALTAGGWPKNAEVCYLRAKTTRYLARRQEDIDKARRELSTALDGMAEPSEDDEEEAYRLRLLSEWIKLGFQNVRHLADNDSGKLRGQQEIIAADVLRVEAALSRVDALAAKVEALNNLAYHTMQLRALGLSWFEVSEAKKWYDQFVEAVAASFGADTKLWPDNYLDTFAWVRLRFIKESVVEPGSLKQEQELILLNLQRLADRQFAGSFDQRDFKRHLQEAESYFSEISR